MATQPMDQPQTPERSELQVYQPEGATGELRLVRSPEKVLDDAHRAAVALQNVIKNNTAIKPVKFGSKEHLLHEHWGMLGHFFGYCTHIDSVKYVEFPGEEGTIHGFEATAVLMREGSGQIVGRATAMCLDEEENWGEVSEYEYQDVLDEQGKKIWDRGLRDGKGGYVRERVEVGTKRKPLFQLQSMAETRASAKCYRLKLSWVAVLAGYAPTPAEEMPKDSRPADHPTQTAAEELPTELKRKAPQSQPSSLPSQPTWCECEHVSGQHGANPPHACACDGNQWINGRGTVCNCTAFRAKAQEPVTPSYERQPQQRQSAPPPRPAAQPSHSSGQVISPEQSRRFYAKWKQAGKTKAMVTEYLQDRFGISSDRDIPVSNYNEACAWADDRGRF
jgi:hypothetical protein